MSSMDGINVYVSGFSENITKDDLHELFQPYGSIISTFIMTENGKSKCAGFVRFEDHESADQAIKEVNGTTPGNQFNEPLIVRIANKRKRFGDPIPLPATRNWQGNDGNNDIHNIFVFNLDPDTEEIVLWQLFGPFGAVHNVKVVTDKETGKCKGFGFVMMPNYEEALAAIRLLNGYSLNNRTLQVSFKKSKTET